jgi:hypothetical protein
MERATHHTADRSLQASQLRSRVTLILSLVIILPSLWGFGTKFWEFVAIYSGDTDGAFAIAPILNYLLASVGFFCLLCWATAKGMFHDIERPKYTMLENEQRLDAGSES